MGNSDPPDDIRAIVDFLCDEVETEPHLVEEAVNASIQAVANRRPQMTSSGRDGSRAPED